MTPLIEGALLFDFSDGWVVQKYDDHSAYRQGVERLKGRCVVEIDGRAHVIEPGTKAVDFVGLWQSEIHFIEVKDFRGHRIENKKRLLDGELAIEVAVKVRDTIAGIVGAFHRSGHDEWRPFVEALARRGRPHVCLWLEEDTLGRALPERGHPGIALQRELDKQLSWLGPRLLVQSRAHGSKVSGIVVRSLPDGVVELRARMRRAGQITRDEYIGALGAAPQSAGLALKELCARDVLRPVSFAPDVYCAGDRWLGWRGP